jgi:3-hydroxybutyryl-CoA dehydrogenase
LSSVTSISPSQIGPVQGGGSGGGRADAHDLGSDPGHGPRPQGQQRAQATTLGLVPRGDHAHGGAVVLAARVEPPVILRERVHAGELGRKVGKGFFVW